MDNALLFWKLRRPEHPGHSARLQTRRTRHVSTPMQVRSSHGIKTSVEHRMTFTPRTVAPSDSVAHARALLDEYRISHLPVVEKKFLVGIVTARDLSGRRHGAISRTVAHALACRPHRVAVQRVMKTRVYTVGPSDSLKQAARVMARGRIRVLPVTEQEKLRGIISAEDLTRSINRSSYFSLSA
jgi:CBS domain-containing protein